MLLDGQRWPGFAPLTHASEEREYVILHDMNTTTDIQRSLDTLRQSIQQLSNTAGPKSDLRQATDSLSGTLQAFSQQLSQLLGQTQAAQQDAKVAVGTGVAQSGTPQSGEVMNQVMANLAMASQQASQAALAPSHTAPGTVPAPGEPGAGLPFNYQKSPLYHAWLASKPELTGSVAEFSDALTQWQESNPFRVNPKDHSSFESYLQAVTQSTHGGMTDAKADPARYQSHLTTYYGTAAQGNPWANLATPPTAHEVAQWTEPVQQRYRQTVDASISLASLERSGLIQGQGGQNALRSMGIS